MNKEKKFAVFVSGFGRGAIQLMLDYKIGFVKHKLDLVISSIETSKSLEIALQYNINTEVVKFKNKVDFEDKIMYLLLKYNIDFVFLAGWNYIISKKFIDKFNKPIINIHPSLLPSFKGSKAITQAMEAKVKMTGITTHYVDETIDGGQIIEQAVIDIDEKDDFESLDFKIFKKGSELSVTTINKM